MNLITSYKTELELLKKFIEEEEERKETEKVAKKLSDKFTKGNKILICGNVGSQDFTKRYCSTPNSTKPAIMEILQSLVRLISNIATAIPSAIRL